MTEPLTPDLNPQAADAPVSALSHAPDEERVMQMCNHSGGHGRMRVSGSENPGLVWFELLRTPIEGLKPY
ncbi:MAG: hypothetical protein ACO331_15745 [Prochlorothrix sp.]